MASNEIASFKFGPGFFYLGIVSIAGGIFILSMPMPAHAGSILLGFGFLYLFLGTRTYIRMYPDFAVYGVGGGNVIKYADIERMEQKGKTVILHPRDGGKPRRFAISQLRKEDAARFVALLKQMIAEAPATQAADTAVQRHAEQENDAVPVPVSEPEPERAPQQVDRGPGSATGAVPGPGPVPVFNGMVVASLLINTLITVLVGLDPEGLGPIFALFIGFFVVLSLVGLLLLQSGKVKVGNILALIGFAVFVPIGIIGMVGVARHVGFVRRQEAAA